MYRTIESEFWIDNKVKTLSMENKLLFIYLITNEHTHVSGLYHLPVIYISYETGIDSKSVESGLKVLSELNMVEYDPENEIIWVVNMIKRQKGVNPSNKAIWTSVINHLDKKSYSPLVSRLIERYNISELDTLRTPRGHQGDTSRTPRGHQGDTKLTSNGVPYTVTVTDTDTVTDPVPVPVPEAEKEETDSEQFKNFIKTVKTEPEIKRREMRVDVNRIREWYPRWVKDYPDKDLIEEVYLMAGWLSNKKKLQRVDFWASFNKWLKPKKWQLDNTPELPEPKDISEII